MALGAGKVEMTPGKGKGHRQHPWRAPPNPRVGDFLSFLRPPMSSVIVLETCRPRDATRQVRLPSVVWGPPA